MRVISPIATLLAASLLSLSALGQVPATPQAAEAPGTVPRPPKAQSWGSQLGTLVRRYAAALSADRTFLAIMIALPFVMGAMARALS